MKVWVIVDDERGRPYMTGWSHGEFWYSGTDGKSIEKQEAETACEEVNDAIEKAGNGRPLRVKRMELT